MGAQRLSEKKTRAIARDTGLDVIRAWAHGSPAWYDFVTRDHRHGNFNHKSGEWEIVEVDFHYSTCAAIDPASPTGYRADA